MVSVKLPAITRDKELRCGAGGCSLIDKKISHLVPFRGGCKERFWDLFVRDKIKEGPILVATAQIWSSHTCKLIRASKRLNLILSCTENTSMASPLASSPRRLRTLYGLPKTEQEPAQDRRSSPRTRRFFAGISRRANS